MKIERAQEVFDLLEQDGVIQNIVNRANSRSILFAVKEPLENFPKFLLNDNRLRLLAFEYLAIGCTFAENERINDSINPLEKGAQVLEYIDFPDDNQKDISPYYLLCSSLAYYAAFQYSKSFVLLQKIEYQTPITNLISLFLKREYAALRREVNSITFNSDYVEASFLELEETEAHARIYSLVLSKVFNLWLSYLYDGGNDFLTEIQRLLSVLIELADLHNAPDIWWLTRLLRIVFEGFKEATTWKFLPGVIDPENENREAIKRFIHSLAYRKPYSITELFLSQRKTLPKVCDPNNNGCVVSLPTSGGKTRIAEVAIFQALLKNPGSKVFYFAPFRSLAYEIEQSLNSTLGAIGFEVSHIYGGSQFSPIDLEQIQEAQVIVVTPEKAKAIIRANSEIMEEVSLVVIDEGHLVGAGQRRLVLNELFLEELRAYLKNGNGKILTLSAVLPNVEDLACWLTGSEDNYEVNYWRPSSERFGTLNWTGSTVNIEWVNQSPSTPPYNKNFIVQENDFPGDFKQAICASAVKLSSFGSVLIFVTMKASVFTHAKEVLRAMGEDVSDFEWEDEETWNIFNLACEEAFGENSAWIQYAKKGILCHNADLPSNARIPLEKLIRDENPPIIISTSTLGQGVNIGISTVIFAQIWLMGKPILKRDFWNIAGRAGRAFTDTEGKILFAIDRTKKKWQVRRDEGLSQQYFDKRNIESTYSGLLSIFIQLIRKASSLNIEKELLIELIGGNGPEQFDKPQKEMAELIEEAFEVIDDTLLALDLEFEAYNKEDPNYWIDNFFRNSLAAIQDEEVSDIDADDVISFIENRNQKIIDELGTDQDTWKSYITTGIPYNSGKKLREKEDELIQICNDYIASEKEVDDLLIFLKESEEILADLSLFQNDSKLEKIRENSELIDAIRPLWINASPLSEINNLQGKLNVIESYYSFTLPWALNGAAKYLKSNGHIEQAEEYELLAICCELGLPTDEAIKIYLSGIRSRIAANEISAYLPEDSFLNLRLVRDSILRTQEIIRENCSERTIAWLEIFLSQMKRKKVSLKQLNNFTFTADENKNIQNQFEYLVVRKYQDKIFICSPDNSWSIDVSNEKTDFGSVADNPAIKFVYDFENNSWEMTSQDPKIEYI